MHSEPKETNRSLQVAVVLLVLALITVVTFCGIRQNNMRAELRKKDYEIARKDLVIDSLTDPATQEGWYEAQWNSDQDTAGVRP